MKENEDDIIIQDNYVNDEIIITDNNNKNINKDNKDEEEINKILNKKTKRNNKINKIDFQINKISNNNNTDKNKEKENTLNKNKNKKKLVKSNTINHDKNKNNKISIYKIESPSEKKEKKEKIKQNAINNFIKLLNEIPLFKEKGENYINNSAKKLEQELSKLHPKIEFEYQKTLNNMYKVLKELIKYKNVCQKILDDKISLFKIAKFNFGDKLIEKLKKVNENKHTKMIKKEKHQNKDNIYSNFLDYNVNNNYSPIKNNTKLNKNNDKNNNDKSKAQFSPTKLYISSASKLFNTSFGEEIHLYEPLSKDKLDYKDFIPILFEPNSEENTNNHTEENSMEEDDDNNDNNEENENENNVNNNEENNNEKNENDIEKNNDIIPPKGSTLRIFHGKIKMNHNRINKVSILTKNKYEKIIKFPKFDNELILPSKAKTKEVLPYCKKHFKNKSRIFLYGWLEPDLNDMTEEEKDNEINKFIEIINEFETKDKCSCLINQKIKLYFFVIHDNQDEFNNKIISKFDFIDNKLKEKLKIEKKFLIYVMLLNNNELNSENTKQQEDDNIEPEIIKLITNSDVGKGEGSHSQSPIPAPSPTPSQEDENEKLKKLFSQKDFDINEYAEKNFKNLSPQEMSNKLLKLNEENRIKLSEAIQKHISNQNNNNTYNNQNLMTPFYNNNYNNMMNNMYLYQMDKQKNMNINMNINNINKFLYKFWNKNFFHKKKKG